jgi:hypothetical protein
MADVTLPRPDLDNIGDRKNKLARCQEDCQPIRHASGLNEGVTFDRENVGWIHTSVVHCARDGHQCSCSKWGQRDPSLSLEMFPSVPSGIEEL